MKKVRIGVFGAGRGFALCESASFFPEAELVAVCDSYEPLLDRIKKFSEEKGLDVTCYTNFDDFIKQLQSRQTLLDAGFGIIVYMTGTVLPLPIQKILSFLNMYSKKLKYIFFIF